MFQTALRDSECNIKFAGVIALSLHCHCRRLFCGSLRHLLIVLISERIVSSVTQGKSFPVCKNNLFYRLHARFAVWEHHIFHPGRAVYQLLIRNVNRLDPKALLKTAAVAFLLCSPESHRDITPVNIRSVGYGVIRSVSQRCLSSIRLQISQYSIVLGHGLSRIRFIFHTAHPDRFRRKCLALDGESSRLRPDILSVSDNDKLRFAHFPRNRFHRIITSRL